MPTKTYTRKQMIDDISVLKDGRILRIPDPDHGPSAEWNRKMKRWGHVRRGTTCGDWMDGRDLIKREIAELTADGAIPQG